MTFPTPAFADIRNAFHTIATTSHQGIPGIMVVESGNPGPTLGITMMTHGNEPSGLAPFWYFTQIAPLADNLQNGKVIFILNNLEAAQTYFQLPEDASMEQRIATRGIALNMNRLPEDALTRKDDPRSEITRVQTLAPLWATFDAGLDVHSTSLESPPMIVGHPEINPALIRGFPIDVLLSGFGTAMRDKPAFFFYGTAKPDSSHLLIETGSHENPLSFQRAIACTQSLLENLGMVSASQHEPTTRTYQHYKVTSSLFFPHESYRTTAIFPNFEPITHGQILATGNGEDLLAPHHGHALMCFATGRPPSLTEEALFISQPVETVTL